jgi:hypothetical protein
MRQNPHRQGKYSVNLGVTEYRLIAGTEDTLKFQTKGKPSVKAGDSLTVEFQRV